MKLVSRIENEEVCVIVKEYLERKFPDFTANVKNSNSYYSSDRGMTATLTSKDHKENDDDPE